MRDAQGPVAKTVGTVQTFLTAVVVDALVGNYLAEMSIKLLTERNNTDRATLFSPLHIRNVLACLLGLSLDDKAEAALLAREGVSVQAISRWIGVDCKVARAVLLVEIGVTVDAATDGMSQGSSSA